MIDGQQGRGLIWQHHSYPKDQIQACNIDSPSSRPEEGLRDVLRCGRCHGLWLCLAESRPIQRII